MRTTPISRIFKILTITYFQLNILTRLNSINVAFNKIALDCKNNVLSHLMFDGDTTYDNVEIISTKCPIFAFIEVNLDGRFEIHYVVIFEGKNNGTTNGQLDYFIVKVYKGESLIICSEFPGRSFGWNGGMRVNCAPLHDLVDKLQIQSRKNDGFYISEIEVHTLASGISGERLLIYRGCSRRFDGIGRVLKQPILDYCHQKCLSLRKLFIAIRGNKYCYCQDHYDAKSEIPADKCDMKCESGEGFCGGVRYYSVYLVSLPLPIYRRCTQKLDQSIIDHFENKNIIESCLYNCDNYNYALIDGMSCLCWNDINNLNLSMQNNCNSTHIGSGHFSVYETCFMLSRQAIKCSELFKCLAPLYDGFGDCGGVCQPGFVGDHCLERITRADISKVTTEENEIEEIIYKDDEIELSQALDAKQAPPCENSTLCDDLPNTVCRIINERDKCLCTPGYESDRKTGGCKDRDECEFEPCNEKTSLCRNLPGTYTCDCYDGFVKVEGEGEQCTSNETDELTFEDARVQRFISAMALLILLLSYCIYAPYTTSHISTSSSSILPRNYP